MFVVFVEPPARLIYVVCFVLILLFQKNINWITIKVYCTPKKCKSASIYPSISACFY